MFFKFVVAAAVVANVDACPSAKKANLRQEGKNENFLSVLTWLSHNNYFILNESYRDKRLPKSAQWDYWTWFS